MEASQSKPFEPVPGKVYLIGGMGHSSTADAACLSVETEVPMRLGLVWRLPVTRQQLKFGFGIVPCLCCSRGKAAIWAQNLCLVLDRRCDRLIGRCR